MTFVLKTNENILPVCQRAAAFPGRDAMATNPCHPPTHLSIKKEMLLHCEVVKQDVMLGAPAQTPPDLSYVS